MSPLKSFTPFQWSEILAVTGFTVYFAVVDKETPLPYTLASSLAAICGIVCVVLCAAGRTAQFYWGIVNVVAYIWVSWKSRLYGETSLNALYYLPLQFWGLYLWKRNAVEGDATRVKAQKLKPATAAVIFAATAVATVAYRDVLFALGGAAVWLDSASTVCSVVANALMILRYREQWTIWIVVDALTVAMWAGIGDPIMTTMWAVFLINAIYGYVQWTRAARIESATRER